MEIPLRVLIVEDNPFDAELVIHRVKQENIDIDYTVVDNEEDYRQYLTDEINLILSDWSLPDFSGLRALQIVSELAKDIPFIIISGSIGEEAAVDAMHRGAADYILKDRPERLGQAIRNALEQKKLRDQHKSDAIELRKAHDYLNNLLTHANAPIIVWDPEFRITRFNGAFERLSGYRSADVIGKTMEFLFPPDSLSSTMEIIYETGSGMNLDGLEIPVLTCNGFTHIVLWNSANIYDPTDKKIIATIAQGQDITDRKEVEKELRKTSLELSYSYDATLQGWSNALELRERETAGHSQRVVQKTIELARFLGVPDEELIHIQRGALLHDIGKMGIPDSILLKPGPLSEEEWEVMRKHPIFAYELLSPIPYLKKALDIPYAHHERWNGSGYPRGLNGEEIPLAARIFSVVDVWDALSFDRPYRSAWNEVEIRKYLQDQAGLQFDPNVVSAFLELLSSQE